MGNPIKYSSTVTSGSYNKGNVAVGTNPINHGPTSTTNWYNSVTPTAGNFIVTEVVDGNTPPRFYAPSTEAEWIRLAKQEGATGVNTGSALAVRNWFASQTNYIVTNIDFPTSMPTIVGDGLVLNLDAKINSSYPGSGTSWNDVSGLGNNGTLTNGPTFNSGLGAIIFDGTNDYVQVTSPFGDIDWSTKAWSFCAFMKLDTLGDKCLVNLNSSNSSHYIVTNVFYTDGKSYWYFIKNSLSIQTNFTQTTSNFETNRAFHFTMTYNGNGLSNGNIKFYKNGELLTTTGGGSAGLSNQSGLQIGGNYPLDGNVYDFLMYDKVLTQTEVKQNYYQSNIVIDGLIYAIDPSNPSSYESGSTTSYSLTGSNTGYLWSGTEFTSNNGGTFKFGTNRNTTVQAVSASNYTSSPINLPGYGSYSINVWVKRTAFGTWKSGNTNYDGIWNYYWDHSLAFTGEHTGINGIYGTGLNAYAINMDQWYNIMVTHKDYSIQNTNNHKTYLNGVLISTATITNPTLDGGLPKRFYIGNWDTSWSMVGEMANFQVYNKELSVTEIDQNFNAYRGKFGV
jgi:hypothetical protein